MSLFEFSSKATDDETWPISATIVGKNTSKGFTVIKKNLKYIFTFMNLKSDYFKGIFHQRSAWI